MKTLLTPGHSPNLVSCLQSTSQHQDPGSGQPSTSSCLDSSHLNQRKDDTTPVKTSPDDDTTPDKTSPAYDDDKVIRPVDKYTLFKVCEHGTLDELKSILSDKTIDINSVVNRDRTAMYDCIISSIQPEEKMRVLISSGAKHDVKDRNGNSLLHVACCFYGVETVELLLNKGMVDMESKNSGGYTPIVVAIRSDKQPVEKVKVLANFGANLNVRFPSHYSDESLLHYACRCHKVEDVEFLLSKNVDIEIRNNANETPIISALRSSTQSIQRVELLLAKGAKLDHSSSILNYACQYGSLDSVKYFIDKGFNVEARNDKNESPLMSAICATTQSLQKVKLLLDKGAKLDSSPNILQYACQYSSLDCVKYFIDKGFNVEARNDKNESPLMSAICSTTQSLQKVKLLLDKGAKLDSSPNILQYACQYGSLDCVKYFIDKGSNVEARNDKNESPLMSAICSTSQSLQKVELLLDKGAKLDSSPNILHYACQYGSLGRVKYFIKKKGFNLESRDDNNRTPLFSCVLTKRNNFINKTDLLMSMNVNKMVRDKNNLSVLQFARQHARKTRVKYLIEKGFTD
ncbi:hypothetical protein SNE40_005996 [Patella caerulea]